MTQPQSDWPDLLHVASAVPVTRLRWRLADQAGVECWLRRDDLLPAWGQGNKFYKLYYNLRTLLPGQLCVSFGGAYSNHLHALALAAQQLKLPAVGIVRGERPPVLSPTLRDVEAAGMQLFFLPRTAYARWADCPDLVAQTDFCAQLIGVPAERLQVIPEGGANALGVAGAEAVGQAIANQGNYHAVCLAVGTGATLAGVVCGLSAAASPARVLGVPVVGPDSETGYEGIAQHIAQWVGETAQGRVQNKAQWHLLPGYSLGGYAKTSAEYMNFLSAFCAETGVVPDHVYTGKLFWALGQLLRSGYWQPGARILALHTGGTQGLRGLKGEAGTALLRMAGG